MPGVSNKEFIDLITKHTGIINSLCYFYFEDKEDRNDARQDIIIQLWKSFESFKGASEVGTWLYRVSLNTILDKKRKESRSLKFFNVDSLSSEPYHKASNDDDKQVLIHLIQSLKELDKAVVILHLEGYKNMEIASMLDLSPSNVGTRLNRIRKLLKAKIEKINYESR